MQKQLPSSYKSIPSFPGYYVNEQGRIIRVYDNGHERELSSNNRSTVTLFKNGERYCKSVTSLFWEAWYGEKTSKGRQTKTVSALQVMDPNPKWIKFDSLTEASKATGAPLSSISKIINGYGYTSHGWAFRLED